MTGFEDGRRVNVKEYRQPLKAGKARKTDSPPERNSLVNALILAPRDSFQASDCQNCKINLCCFKPLSLY